MPFGPCFIPFARITSVRKTKTKKKEDEEAKSQLITSIHLCSHSYTHTYAERRDVSQPVRHGRDCLEPAGASASSGVCPGSCQAGESSTGIRMKEGEGEREGITWVLQIHIDTYV